LSTKSDQLEWRRSKVVEMRARGLSLGEIARELQASRASISSDMQYLRSQDKESIREYILEASEDNREKLQAMELFNI
jgi:transcriptional regulator